MITSTRRALIPSGGRKVATPLEIASSPVSEEPPLAKARSTTKRLAPINSPLGCQGVGPCTAPGRSMGWRCNVPEMDSTTPTITTRPTERMNRYIGRAKILPASRMPRRFP